MKYLFTLSMILISGCSCCGSDIQLPDVVTVTPRYIEVPAIIIDGVMLPLEPVPSIGYSFTGEVTDSVTKKKVGISGIIDTSSRSLNFSVFVPKDSVKSNDTLRERETIKKDDSFFQGITLKDIMIFIGLIAVVAFLITLFKR